MPYYVESTSKYFEKTEEPKDSVWRKLFPPGSTCPASGIYKCQACGDEVTSNKGDPLPPQNHRQHDSAQKISWELVAMTKTK